MIPIEKLRIPARDAYNGYHNNVWRMIYGYRLKAGEVLTPETGKSDGFEWFTLAEIHHAAFLEEEKCIPVIADELYIRCYRALLSST